MAHYIIGTAGHVDHGKSALVKMLTGKDPDRLPEEKIRGLTLDLGFASLDLPSGAECSIVDVPGHEKYLRNMLAGVCGFDFALLVVDAGEGIKEQTREHMEIMQVLGIKDGITVITKIDRVEPEVVDQVERDVVEFLKDTFLHASPVVRVSTLTGEGHESLLHAIDYRIVRLTPRDMNATFRMPIDRVFTKRGVGTIVTGTIYQGRIEENGRVLILPEGKTKKIRGIQVHDKDVSEAVAGQRAALNISGIEMEAIVRGDLLTGPGSGRATGRMDGMIELLKSSPQPLANRSEVRFYSGTSETFAKVILLDRNELKPGERCPAQFIFKDSVALFAGDKFIVRAPSAIHTYGGGVVVEPYPQKHRRFDQKDIDLLKLKENADPAIVMREMMNTSPYILHSLETVLNMVSLQPSEASDILNQLEHDGEIFRFNSGRFVHQKVFGEMTEAMLHALEEFEADNPSRLGTRLEELKLNLPKSEDKLIREIITTMKIQKLIKENNHLFATYDFLPALEGEKVKCLMDVRKQFAELPFSPPGMDELSGSIKYPDKMIKEIIGYMAYSGELIPIDEKIYFLASNLDKAKRIVGHHIVKEGGITASAARQLLGTTRKYVIPLLEYFDRIHFTKRQEDVRVLFRSTVILMEEKK
ncbi:MAG: selenocysteine-specific translation elongation factor [Firmicutes bacterium]|nr:selenocysteine-specific translation elongation factor [Bacillota bacterium]